MHVTYNNYHVNCHFNCIFIEEFIINWNYNQFNIDIFLLFKESDSLHTLQAPAGQTLHV